MLFVMALAFLHELRLGVEHVGVALAVAAVLLVDDGVERWQIVGVGLVGAVVPEQRAEGFAVGGVVPGVAVVVDGDVAALAAALGVDAAEGVEGAGGQLVSASR